MKLEHRFPDLELSYETYAHKKVLTNYDICLAIPTGKKVFAWFSYDEETGKDAIFFVELNKNFKVSKIEKTNFICHHSLAYQTILYGTLTEIDDKGEAEKGDATNNEDNKEEHDENENNKKTFYIVEDVYYYQGLYVKSLTFGIKLYYLHSMFQNKLVPHTFALPYMCLVQPNNMMLDSLSFYESICNQSAYTSHHIQFRSSYEVVPYLNHTYKKKQEQIVSDSVELLFPHKDLSHEAQLALRNAVFKVKADIQADVYHLYAKGTEGARLQKGIGAEGAVSESSRLQKVTSAKDDVYVNIAYIGSIESSKYMNSLFRNIRENINIDYGEESEDEDDFQNVRPDKYVDLNKTYYMNCVYNAKFKKWVPVNVLNTVNCVEITKLIYNQLNKKINHYTNTNKSNKSNYTNNSYKSNNNYKTSYSNKSNNNYKSNKGTFAKGKGGNHMSANADWKVASESEGARTNSTGTGYTPFHKYRRNPRE
jgi:hypothetical protein